MQTLKLDENNNLVIFQENLQVEDGVEACAQDTRTRIGLCRGENPYNTDDGADFFNEFLGKMGGRDYIREVIRQRILDNEEIVQVNSLRLSTEKDKLVISSEISSIYGVLTL